MSTPSPQYCRLDLAPPLADRFIVGVAPIDYGPVLLLKPFGFHLAMDTLPSGEDAGLQVRLSCVRLSPSCPGRRLHTFRSLRPARHYPRLWIWRSSFERQRDFNPPEPRAAQHTLSASLTAIRSSGLPRRVGLSDLTSHRLNRTALPCSHGILRLHASGTNPGSIPGHSPYRSLGFCLPHRAIGSATSTTIDFGVIFPFTRVPAYNLPVYASQCCRSHHARLGTRLRATLCRGRHCRRLNSMSFQGATLTEPCVSLSTHTARATHEGCRLPPTPSSSSRYRLAKQVGTSDLLPWLHGHYPVSSLLRSSPPLVGALVLSASWGFHLYLSLGITDPVLTFRTKAQIRVMPPIHRTPHGQ